MIGGKRAEKSRVNALPSPVDQTSKSTRWPNRSCRLLTFFFDSHESNRGVRRKKNLKLWRAIINKSLTLCLFSLRFHSLLYCLIDESTRRSQLQSKPYDAWVYVGKTSIKKRSLRLAQRAHLPQLLLPHCDWVKLYKVIKSTFMS